MGRDRRRALKVGVVVAACALAYVALRPSTSEPLTPDEIARLHDALLARVRAGGPNHLHSRRLYFYAEPFARARGADVDVVRAAALLHDATKEDGDGEPKERFCTHGEQGADYTEATLLDLGKSGRFARAAAEAVEQHMGPCGFNWRFVSRRFMSKFCDREFPTPSSPEAEVLYDVDMLDLMTVDGVVKVTELRQTNPEFGKEPIKDSVVSGDDSAWKSVIDAKQTLLTERAKACGDDLAGHTWAFVDGLDFEDIEDLAAFKRAARDYLTQHPLPDCLPHVPPWDGDGL